MNVLNILFYTFAVISILSAIFLVSVSNPIYSIMLLIVVFINVSALLLMIGAEFLSLTFIIVYVGAIAVLFLFVIMMLNIKVINKNNNLFMNYPIGGLIGFIFLIEIISIVNNDFTLPLSSIDFNNNLNYIDWIKTSKYLNNVQSLGVVLYTHYSYFFIMASLILLVAMIGAIILTMSHSISIKKQSIQDQVITNSDIALSYKE